MVPWRHGFIAVCLLSSGAWREALPAAPRSEPKALVTSARAFSVPFAVDAGTDVEYVQLLVSTDHGASWNMAQSVRPKFGYFPFQAKTTGEYWFFIRTVNAQGRFSPETEPTAELRVIVDGPVRPTAAVTAAPIEQTSAAAEMEPAFSAPNGQLQPRMINRRTIDIDYDAPTDASTPREVAVWLTRDGGRNWFRHAVDDDCRSPVRVTLPQDGTYGLWIVMTEADGRKAAEPKPGDMPGIWLGIDTAGPSAQLLTAETSLVRGAREMSIRWEASDARLALAPITLSYRGSTNEPWRPLAAELLNTGVHTARLDDNWPDQVLLRLEVIDEAGNRKVVETNEPVSTRNATVAQRPRDQSIQVGVRTFQVLR